ncbi:hypothetical protein NEOLEDRAFT_1183592 [Neolentinus lepideus HHB14362 ss-1]|uniref:Diphosphomevalonate decarboxylase-like N-terminal domain-containing protein n=1 Tax=Neolentinus lepideus HHB14362 ss-1 TaxID=1314782 RepID=A0A165N5X8_9AGAM|nr:hypothetical protein NEOLEDRAFT_1183592 [Neolentinus lepideus HHB14362 ss-1]
MVPPLHLQQASMMATANYPKMLHAVAVINTLSHFSTVWGWIKVQALHEAEAVVIKQEQVNDLERVQKVEDCQLMLKDGQLRNMEIRCVELAHQESELESRHVQEDSQLDGQGFCAQVDSQYNCNLLLSMHYNSHVTWFDDQDSDGRQQPHVQPPHVQTPHFPLSLLSLRPPLLSSLSSPDTALAPPAAPSLVATSPGPGRWAPSPMAPTRSRLKLLAKMRTVGKKKEEGHQKQHRRAAHRPDIPSFTTSSTLCLSAWTHNGRLKSVPLRQSQLLQTAPRLGSHSPASIPSSLTSVHSSSSAIFECNIEPLTPSQPMHTSNPHLIPRSKGTEAIEQSVPSVLNSASIVLVSTSPEQEDFVSVPGRTRPEKELAAEPPESTIWIDQAANRNWYRDVESCYDQPELARPTVLTQQQQQQQNSLDTSQPLSTPTSVYFSTASISSMGSSPTTLEHPSDLHTPTHYSPGPVSPSDMYHGSLASMSASPLMSAGGVAPSVAKNECGEVAELYELCGPALLHPCLHTTFVFAHLICAGIGKSTHNMTTTSSSLCIATHMSHDSTIKTVMDASHTFNHLTCRPPTFHFRFSLSSPSPSELSLIARHGSGSACCSFFGGYVSWAWEMGTKPNGSNSLAIEVAGQNAHHRREEGRTSETASACSSLARCPLLHHIKHVVPERMELIRKVVKLQNSSMPHSTPPPIFYMNDISPPKIIALQMVTAKIDDALLAKTLINTSAPQCSFILHFLNFSVNILTRPSSNIGLGALRKCSRGSGKMLK